MDSITTTTVPSTEQENISELSTEELISRIDSQNQNVFRKMQYLYYYLYENNAGNLPDIEWLKEYADRHIDTKKSSDITQNLLERYNQLSKTLAEVKNQQTEKIKMIQDETTELNNASAKIKEMIGIVNKYSPKISIGSPTGAPGPPPGQKPPMGPTGS